MISVKWSGKDVKEAVVAYYRGMCLEGLRKSTKNWFLDDIL
jgi:hypothetical protein